MTCDDFDPLLHPLLDGELIAADRAEVEAHLLACPVCSKKAEHERLLVDLVRTRAQEASPKAPEALKVRLLESIHREESSQRRRAALRWAMAAGIAGFAVFAGSHEWQKFERTQDWDLLTRIHSQQDKLRLDVEGRSDQLAAALSSRLGYRVRVPNIPNATATGARFINVRGKDAVLIRYEVNGGRQPLSLVVYGDDPQPTDPEYEQSNGYNTVSWHDGDVSYHLLTDLDEGDIRQLVPPAALAAPSHGTKLPNLDARPASLNR
jgi:anti-sigma factor (TIGR02949 family)